ncbi:MAG: pyridoxamine 5'-phosphate oxidase family protein [Eubacterium sp.]|jgi:nitroimidazol reductase NimA-like FMN-containing flavoprotein (pyridoxamine 5'-phosphate oxidase superfamily)|nr:pyridoxamine 5'-phosphate oxidase family protein [Eubacterium sp.]MCH4045981.1 pyridoxamine 5'-phosphate oxidase family protein [Eubacterium sp.]MCH4079075.1 pyridoxamine 5'-phosphate oxidase family protein [Eubacterium sp.]MCH4110798.1 pyridoxamine 5'-phosphate oxidase family protein [Eubacterium sp.]MCI1306940.1 pyridoxamine 5'-phosphate oxidase family protein [Eubacterium sp.]
MTMRKKDREVTDTGVIREIIDACRILHVGLCDGKRPYVVPVNFGFEDDNGHFTFYFHGAAEGRKISLIRENGYAALEGECDHGTQSHETACGHTEFFQSFIAEGKAEEILDSAEKKRILQLIMSRYTDRSDWEFPDAAVKATAVVRIRAEQLSVKQNG